MRQNRAALALLCAATLVAVCILISACVVSYSSRLRSHIPPIYGQYLPNQGGSRLEGGPPVPVMSTPLVRELAGGLAHSNWQPIRGNLNLLTLSRPCSTEAATRLTREAVEIVNAFVDSGYRDLPHDALPTDALPKYAAARQEDPKCVSALLGHAILLAVTRDHTGCEAAAAEAEKQAPHEPHAPFWRGVCMELQGMDPRQMYFRMRDIAPSMCIEAFAQRCESPYFPHMLFSDPSLKSARGREIESVALLRIMLAWEYGSQALSAMSPLRREDAVQFPTTSAVKIPGILQGLPLQAFQDMWLNLIKEGEIHFGDPQVPTRYGHSNDMASHFLLGSFNDVVQRVAGRLTKPTYTYFGGYKGGSVLHPHTDRLACEFTMTFQIHLDPIRPLWGFLIDDNVLSVAPGDRGGSKPRARTGHEVRIDLEPGDAGLIRGRKVNHYREALPAGQTSLNIFFHFVFNDFPEEKFGM